MILLVEEEEEERDDSTEDSVAFIPDDEEEKEEDEGDVDELFLSLITSGSNCSISIMMALRPLINGSN